MNHEWRSPHWSTIAAMATIMRDDALDRASTMTTAGISTSNVNEWRSFHRNSNSSSRTAARRRARSYIRNTTAGISSSNVNEWRSLHRNSDSSSRTAASRRARSCLATTTACISSSDINEWRSFHRNSNSSSRTAARRRARSCINNDDGGYLEQQRK